jgi:YVTN family beta-propeller protein
MRYVEGTDLARHLRREGPLAPAAAISMLEQVGAALDAAHRRGLIHRDVKPGNVLIASGHCYLTDFGLIKRASASEVSRALTATGQFLGTVDYVAPEQIEGREVDARSDIYALACMLHECLTGSRPFQKDSEVAVIYAHLHDPPPCPTRLRPELPAAINGVVATGMAKSPEARYPTCSELIDAARAALGVASSGKPATRSAPLGNGSPNPTHSDRSAFVRPQTGSASTIPHDGRTGQGARGRRSRRRTLALAIAGVGGAAAIAVAAVLAVSGGHGTRERAQAATTPTADARSLAGAHLAGAPITVGKAPIGIAGNSTVLWVANFDDSTVTRVSPNGKIRTDIALADGPFGVFSAGGQFWVSSADAGVVTPISVATGSPGKPIHVGRHPEFITGDENSVYVSNAFDDTVSVIDPRADTPVGRPIRVGRFPRGIASSGTAVWVADYDDNNDDRIVIGQVIKTIPVGRHPVGVAVGANAVWVANEADNTVSRIDLGPGGKVKTIRVGTAPFAIAFGLGSAWVTNRRDDTVTRLDAATGNPIGRPIAVGKDPTGVAVIGNAVYVTNRGSATIQQIQP